MKLAVAENPRSRQGELGQFLTASPVADFMASMFGPLPRTVRLLDAGAGAGALTAAFISRCCEKRDGVSAIEATLYELDGEILDALSSTMQECKHRCADAGIRFTFTIHSADFIQEMSARLAGDLFGAHPPVFDVAIANPPYRKINTESAERRALVRSESKPATSTPASSPLFNACSVAVGNSLALLHAVFAMAPTSVRSAKTY